MGGFANYRIEGELARGGLGRILKAHDLALDRPVALKLPLSSAGAARFERESRLTARLQHPSIVAVYEAGHTPSGEPFYAMKWLSGRALGEVIASVSSLEERIALLPHVIAVADATAYAHSRRIIHRDIKPSNILVGAFGETVLLDWGLAKDLAAGGPDEAVPDGAPGQTSEGAVLGTPAYMPPEQAVGAAVDERADVYSLGAVLYELLAGGAPYSGASAKDVIAALSTRPPVALGERAPGVPADLAAVVHRAMARDPAARYPTAAELAADLRRFATGQLVSSHHYSMGALLRRWLQRHRVLVSAAVLVLAVVVVATAVSFRRVERAGLVAARRRDELVLAQARSALQRDPTLAAAWLAQYPLAGAEWPRVRSLLSEVERSGVAREVFRDYQSSFFSRHAYAVALTDDGRVLIRDRGRSQTLSMPGESDLVAMPLSDGQRLITYGSRHVLQMWDLATGQPRTLWSGGPADEATGFEVSHDGTAAAASLPDGTMLLFSLGDGAMRRLSGHQGNVYDWHFSLDGKWLASAGEDKTVRLWEVATGEGKIAATHDLPVRYLDFSSGGLLASAGYDRTIRISDPAGGPERKLTGHTAAIFGLAFSPDGKQLASASEDHSVRLWDVATGEGRVLAGHEGSVAAVAYSPDGRRIASGGEDSTVRVWDTESGECQVLRGHSAPLIGLGFTPDGRSLSSYSVNNERRTWEIASSSDRVLRGVNGGALAISYSHDGRHLAWSSFEGSVRLCTAGGDCQALPGSRGRIPSLSFSADDRWLGWGGADGVARVWDLAAGVQRELKGHTATIKQVAFSPVGSRLASAADDFTVRLWDVESGGGQVVTRHTDILLALAFSSDGRRVASAGMDRTVRVFEVDGGRTQTMSGHTGWVMAVSFSPDGTQLASASWDNTVREWDAAGHELRRLEVRRPSTVAYSPDGRTLAAGDGSGGVYLWTGGVERHLREHRGGVRQVLFSPDGRFLASAGEDRTVRLSEVATGESRVLGLHDSVVRRLSFSPDGKTLASCGNDAAARLWPVEWRSESASTVRARLGKLTTAVLDDEERATTP